MRNQKRHQVTRLGSLLVKRGLISTAQLDAALRLQRTRPRVTLGEILVSQGLVSEAELNSLLRHQTRVRWLFAVVAMFTAPLQWAIAGPLPSASANAEQVAFAQAADYANSPQLRLHDLSYTGEKFSTSASKLGQRILKRAYNSLRADPSNQFNTADRNSDALTLTNTSKGSYSMSLSESRVMFRMKFRFSD